MPWKETSTMEEKARFVFALRDGEGTMAELCRRFGISRMTGYRLWHRFVREGMSGLDERSRRPLSSPSMVAADVRARILELRVKRPTWGPKKLIAYLARQEPDVAWPARSTVAALLKREGLSEARRRRLPRSAPQGPPEYLGEKANETWTVDFKGWFRAGNGERIDPLTVSDRASRYLLCVRGLPGCTSAEMVRPLFIRCFEEYGLPRAILSDNGVPFAAAHGVGLTRLCVWWMELGIVPLRTEVSSPEQNGRHERMHRVLKRETASPPAASMAAQQRRFDDFRRVYNEERPHEGLGFRTPSDHYEVSGRPYPGDVAAQYDYPSEMAVRKVGASGRIKWQNEFFFISAALSGKHVGLERVEEKAMLRVWYRDHLLGTLEPPCLHIRGNPDLWTRRGEGEG